MVKYSKYQQRDRPLVDNGLLASYQSAKYNKRFCNNKKSTSHQQKMTFQDQKWYRKLLVSGTTQDKISALTIQIKDNPEFCLDSLEQLLQLLKTIKQRKENLQCLYNIKDIFVHLLLKKRQLKTFQELLRQTKSPSDKQLAEFFLSHNLKRIFNQYLQIVQERQDDSLVYIRRKVLIILVELLCSNTEATMVLIPSLVNKFGDNDKILVANLTKTLARQLNKTPDLVIRILKELSNFIYRPNLKQEAQFYALNFINQLNYETMDSLTLKYILKLLFSLFTKLMNLDDPSTECSKLLNQILRGINKILPYAKNDVKQLITIQTKKQSGVDSIYKENEDHLYALIHKSSNFKIKIQTLYFIFQVFNGNQPFTDRYYRSLYDLLFNPEIEKTKLQELFFDLLFLSLKQDELLPRQKAFVKRLLQVASQSRPSFIITSLVFVSKIMEQVKGLKSMLQQPEQLFQDEEEEEHYVDVEESAEQIKNEVDVKQDKQQEYYNPNKREPKFCKAETTSLFEVTSFLKHYHPKVRLLNKPQNQKGQRICLNSPKENPLLEYDLSAFLSKFIERSTRKTKRMSVKTIQMEDEVDGVDESNRYMLKFLKQKYKQTQEKLKAKPNLAKKQLGQEAEDEEEDQFADELFEKELQKGEDVDFDVDDDEEIDFGDDVSNQNSDDLMYNEDDDDDYELDGQDFNETKQVSKKKEPQPKSSKKPIIKKIKKTKSNKKQKKR